MAEFLNGLKRTKKCANVNLEDVGKEITLMGWVDRRRNLGNLLFVFLRDVSGVVQLVFNTNEIEQAQDLKYEYVISVKGIVSERSAENINSNLKTGRVEVNVKELKILSESETLPFMLDYSKIEPSENLRYKYRYLDLRRPYLQNIFKTRNKIAQIMRNFLWEKEFLEIETPFFGRSTPEGAREYLVPSRVNAGKFYSLPQSPQIYKQLLMISGYDRYFQIVKCFRDEDLRKNRQPEFTQLDLEMSFVDKEEQVMSIVEELVKRIFKETLNLDFKEPFRVITYKEAMENYGSDKPDLRFDLKLHKINQNVENLEFDAFKNALGGGVYAIVGKDMANSISRKEQDRLQDLVRTYRAKGLFTISVLENEIKTSLSKFLSEEQIKGLVNQLGATTNDMIFICADKNEEIAQTAMGALRLRLADNFNLIDKNAYEIAWVTEFPLFEFNEEDNRLYAKHHPFTSPKEEDMHLLSTDPTKIRSKAYDLVINGEEAGGGSIRIYNQELQKTIFNALGFTEEDIKNKFSFFVEAFKYGTPPHGGLAIGLDRLVMTICKTEDIKDVIAFPKTQNATDLMTEAPSVVTLKQLEELSIKVVNSDE